ncbi:Chondroitinase-B precursor [Pirellulimonas nuda]|uniref:Probable pectate lyase C n=1 Tax=Pirellulimonas nuda TaxID=2528009 RepID=A0A518D611_9BACT|nr:Chondroitinase-B precursor [Pirellulimonas nuda]
MILNGTSQLLISGGHLVVDGLHFKNGTIVNSDHVVQFRGPLGEAHDSRFTNSVIESYNPADLTDKYHWVSLYGQNNRVDHNRFIDQKNPGPTVIAWLDETGVIAEARHQIDSNHFADRPVGYENGFETIRLGDSDTSHYNAHILVENNLFERQDGEIEIISSKSNDNVFRYNTFRESAGTLTLRHGHRATVEGNFFLGEGRAGSGGVRVVGEDHVIVNNYIADVDDEADGAISLTAGIPNTIPSGYQQVKNATIAHNTIVNVGGAAITLDWGLGSSGRSLLPQNVTIARNLIQSTAAPLFEGAEGTGFTWADNIAFGAALGISARPGINVVDPQLELGPDGLWRPSATSPAIDAVASGFVTVDFDGQPRIGLFDIGADENSFAQIVRKPLTTVDVGASWFNYSAPDSWPPPIPIPAGPFQVVEAEDFTSVTDPDGNGQVWTIVQNGAASGGAAIKAPSTGSSSNINLSTTPHDTLALYDLAFSEAGTYTAYYLARGFDGSSDSIFTPSGFGVDPAVVDNLSSNGAFRWETGGQFTISQSNVGMPLEFRLGRRERNAEIDAILFHQNSSLTAIQLDAILASLEPALSDGDYNGDGVVDAADYTTWRDNLGSSVTLPGDTTPGSVTQADYDVWRNNFGASGGAAPASAAVPEPGGLALLTLAVGVSLIAPRRNA